MKITKETKVKLGGWLLDVAKYILTGVIITSFLGMFDSVWLLYLVGMTTLLAFFLFGLWFTNNNT